MNIAERVKRICLSPDTEWPVIAGESTPLGTLLTTYVLPLAGVSAVALLIGSVLSGLSVMIALRLAVTGLVIALAGVAVMAFIIEALAPTFGAEKSSDRAAKVAAYSPTSAWVAGVAQIIPYIGGLIALLGGLYALYLLYLGLLRVMKSPPDKAVAYTAVVVVLGIVLAFAVNFVAGSLGIGAGMMPAYTLD
jgi:Yip1 domain